jgi:hypothetical protein
MVYLSRLTFAVILAGTVDGFNQATFRSSRSE